MPTSVRGLPPSASRRGRAAGLDRGLALGAALGTRDDARTARTSPTGVAGDAPDAEIMRRLAGGDTGALGELTTCDCRSLRRFLARATADAEDVDDLVHATSWPPVESAARYDGRLYCRPWLIGIAAQLLRRRRRTFGRLFAFLSSVGGRRPAASIHGRRSRPAGTSGARCSRSASPSGYAS